MALKSLREGNHPRMILLREKHSTNAWYLMQNASKSGFGTGIYFKGELMQK